MSGSDRRPRSATVAVAGAAGYLASVLLPWGWLPASPLTGVEAVGPLPALLVGVVLWLYLRRGWGPAAKLSGAFFGSFAALVAYRFVVIPEERIVGPWSRGIGVVRIVEAEPAFGAYLAFLAAILLVAGSVAGAVFHEA